MKSHTKPALIPPTSWELSAGLPGVLGDLWARVTQAFLWAVWLEDEHCCLISISPMVSSGFCGGAGFVSGP